MRLLHTSDWHLGRSFHDVGLLRAQELYLDHLVEVARAEAVDAVVVSGDIYDRALPSPDTVALLDDALFRLLDTGATVVLSSGNHDSAIRLGFGSRVLARAGLHIRTSLSEIGTPVELDGGVIYPLPYLEPAITAGPLEAADRTHAGVLRAAMRRVNADAAGRSVPTVVMAHAFVTGATTSDSERDITVGGVGAVPLSVFAGMSYAALGHLHRPQQLDDGALYSGSPVAMSFSEAGQDKSTVLVDLDRDGVRTSLITAPVDRPLARLRGSLDDLLLDPRLTWAEKAWCEVTLTDPVRPIGAMAQIKRRFEHTLTLGFAAEVEQIPTRSYTERTQGRSDLDLCCDFLSHVRGGAAATDTDRQVFSEAFEQSRLRRSDKSDESGSRTAHGAA